ncbi:hypothetical protein [Tahibacter amnicola]|uniref:Uncharacterized protein n=1 Tax=Tahibacter amnicola TaxID=2976241 RepID=A0ABY6BCB6_9GAMM|nr:hypothetical protein [Tahibacter amnicola]UXI67216.1 hypothetical protein N4264_21125 [Tahibacter amnicola]
MSLRLWQRLFLAFAILSGAALVSYVIWQQGAFRRGFLDYLNGLGRQRIEQQLPQLAQAYAQHGSWDFLHNDPGELVRALGLREEGMAAEPGVGAAREGRPPHRPPPGQGPDYRPPPGRRIVTPHRRTRRVAARPTIRPTAARTKAGRRPAVTGKARPAAIVRVPAPSTWVPVCTCSTHRVAMCSAIPLSRW